MGKSNTNNKSDKTGSYTDFFCYFFRNILLASIPLVIISAIVLSSFRISATGSGSGTDSLTISISSACTLSSVVNTEHSDNVKAGTYKDDIGKTTIKTTCNDNNGYSIYANGYSNNEEGNNKLINTLSPSNVIETGLNTSGDSSSWAMKLNNIPDDPSPTPPVIESAYDDTYGIIPSSWTKVLSLSSGTIDMSLGSSFTTTYAVYANSRQYTGTYQGQVKYVLTHPNINKPTLNSLELAFMSHGKQIAYQDEYGSYFAMQDMTTDICNSVSEYGEATATQLVDTRDNKLYYVTKLADGHCWMTQNLDLDINTNVILNSTNTDLNVIYNPSTGQYAEYSVGYTRENNIIYWKPDSIANTISFIGSEGVNVSGWASSDNKPYSASDSNDLGVGHASLGNLYNWTASIASNNSVSISSNTFNDISANPQNSICPKGWRLYTASNQSGASIGSTNEFARLNYVYNNNKTNTDAGLISSPLYFTYPGYIRNNVLNRLNEMGVYWSSSNVTGHDAGRSYINGAQVAINDVNIGNRGSGFSVRCVAR